MPALNNNSASVMECSNAGFEYLSVKFNNPSSSTSTSALLVKTESGENLAPHLIGPPSARQKELTISYPGG
jgi:uncharacterized protein (DUF736 family)